jgi:hypothetical protein
VIAQLGERETEDLEVPGSIPGHGILFTDYVRDRQLNGASSVCTRHSIVLAEFRDSIVVSISACHADDPGSIPGRGVLPPDLLTRDPAKKK